MPLPPAAQLVVSRHQSPNACNRRLGGRRIIASTAGVDGATLNPGAVGRLADRWIYVFMAGLFIVTALIGFIPTSLRLLAAIEAGQRPPLPPILHIHAVLMGSWLLLLLAQTTLMATGRSALHKKLGLVAAVLAPAVLVAMIGVVKSRWSPIASLPPDLLTPGELSRTNFLSNVLLEQIRMAVLFSGFVIWALLTRRRNPETHKRLMILATLTPLPAAIDRMAWLPATMAASPTSMPVYTLLWLLPVLIYDVARRGRVHSAYVIGIALNLPFVIASHFLWGSPWWLATAPRLMDVQGW